MCCLNVSNPFSGCQPTPFTVHVGAPGWFTRKENQHRSLVCYQENTLRESWSSPVPTTRQQLNTHVCAIVSHFDFVRGFLPWESAMEQNVLARRHVVCCGGRGRSRFSHFWCSGVPANNVRTVNIVDATAVVGIIFFYFSDYYRFRKIPSRLKHPVITETGTIDVVRL